MKRYEVHGSITIGFSVELSAESREEAEAFVHEEGVPEMFWTTEEIDIWEVRGAE